MTHKQPLFDSSSVKVIVGLGNPGPRYHETRHNVGFMFLDYFLEAIDPSASWQKQDGFYSAEISISDKSFLLLKPFTGMNISSQPIAKMLAKRSIKSADVLVCHDELEKAAGSYAFKIGGSARGHNGVRSMISLLGDEFWRLRLGIARPENKDDVPDYVLARFAPAEMALWPATFQAIIDNFFS